MPKGYSLAPRRVSAGARFFFGIGTHIVLKTHSQDTQVFFLLSFSSLPPPLPFLFLLFFSCFIKTPIYFTLPIFVSYPVKVWKGARTLLFIPLCCTCFSLAHFLNNNPLAFCAVFFKFQVVAEHLPCAPIKEKLDQLSARSLSGLVVESRKFQPKGISQM